MGRTEREVPQAWINAWGRGDAALARYEAGGISLKKLGAEMGVSQSRARQIVAQALRRRRRAEWEQQKAEAAGPSLL